MTFVALFPPVPAALTAPYPKSPHLEQPSVRIFLTAFPLRLILYFDPAILHPGFFCCFSFLFLIFMLDGLLPMTRRILPRLPPFLYAFLH